MFRISAPHFVAAVIPGVKAAPIISYMLLWNEKMIRDYCAKKKWQVEKLEIPNG